ncbi:hypothetical protein HGRIS_010366 [Hohenbuehelia grisea]|uniref:Uncharacterized protein n=1 Tax=Hohenbuehelia grisea TaxID=104357 RepID=A0ABR3J446_9AGAR
MPRCQQKAFLMHNRVLAGVLIGNEGVSASSSVATEKVFGSSTCSTLRGTASDVQEPSTSARQRRRRAIFTLLLQPGRGFNWGPIPYKYRCRIRREPEYPRIDRQPQSLRVGSFSHVPEVQGKENRAVAA